MQVVAHGAFYSALARAGTLVGSLAFAAILSRHVGVRGFGEYAYALSIATICGTLVMFGLDQVAIRDLSQQRAEPAFLFGRVLAIQGSMAALCFVAVLGGAALFGSAEERLIVLALVLLHTFTEQASMAFVSLFRARNRMDYEATTNWVWAITLIAGALAGAAAGLSLGGLLALAFLAYSARLGSVLFLVTRVLKVRDILGHVRLDGALARGAAPLLVLGLASIVYAAFPRLIVNARLTLHDVGLYAAAERIVQLVAGVFVIVDVVVFPLFARHAAESRERFAATYERTADAFLAFGLLVGLACAAVGPEIVRVLFGPAFVASVPLFTVLFPTVSMSISGYVTMRAMISLRRDRILAAWMITTLLIGLPLAWWAAHRWGLMGVAWAWSFPIGLGFVGFFVYLREALKLRWRQWRYAIYFAVFAASFLVSARVQDASLGTRLLVHAAIIGSLGMLFVLTGLARPADVRALLGSMPGASRMARA